MNTNCGVGKYSSTFAMVCWRVLSSSTTPASTAPAPRSAGR
nr:hypothetical protein [Kytococcus sedentarius]